MKKRKTGFNNEHESVSFDILKTLKENKQESKLFGLNQLLEVKEARLVMLEEHIKKSQQFVWMTRKELRKDRLDGDAIREHEQYQYAFEQVDIVQSRHTELKDKIEELQQSIRDFEQEMENTVAIELFTSNTTTTPQNNESAAFYKFKMGHEFLTNDFDEPDKELDSGYREEDID